MLARESLGAIWSKCCLKCLATLPRNISQGKQRCKHTHTHFDSPTCNTLWLPCCVFLSLVLHGTLLSPPAHWTLLLPPTRSASLPPACLYHSLASPNSLQAYTHFQLFLPLTQSDLTGEHSCPAAIPPCGLFCSGLFPLSSSATTLLPLLPCPSLFPPVRQGMSHPSFHPGLICLQYVALLSFSLSFSKSGFPLLELPPYWSRKVWVATWPQDLYCLGQQFLVWSPAENWSQESCQTKTDSPTPIDSASGRRAISTETGRTWPPLELNPLQAHRWSGKRSGFHVRGWVELFQSNSVGW